MSDSSDSDTDVSDNFAKSVDNLARMKPEYTANTKIVSVKDIRSSLRNTRGAKLSDNKPNADEPCQSKNLRAASKPANKSNERKVLQDSFREITTDLSNLNTKIEVLFTSMINILDKLDEYETRLLKLEERPTPQASYASQVRSAPPSDHDRVDRLEYQASEQEREKRNCQVTISHPKIETSSADLTNHIKNFMETDLKMDIREVDVNMTVRKIRDKTVLVNFSSKRYKGFIFSSRKNLRSNSEPITNELYINENLTPYNFKLLKTLKEEKKRRISAENEIKIDSVYTFEGKVFAKVNRNAVANCKSVHIKSPAVLNEFLRGLNNAI